MFLIEETEKQIQRVKLYKKNRNNKLLDNALKELKEKAKSDSNLFQYIINAVQAQATLGEISNILRAEFGEYVKF